jgi:hypothetical protein
MPEKPLARVFYGLTSLSAIAGTTLAFVLYGFGTSGPPDTTPGMFDVYGQNMIGRLADTISYFTTWSNVLVAIVFALLAIRVSGRGHITHVLLFSALLMILVAGLVDNAILAPAVAPRHGWELLTTTLEHTITPLLALFAWAIFGPRDPNRLGRVYDHPRRDHHRLPVWLPQRRQAWLSDGAAGCRRRGHRRHCGLLFPDWD